MIHKTAEVSPLAKIGNNTHIWHQAQIRENATIGKNCIIGKGVYIDKNVKIGDNCKIQNYVCVYQGAVIKNNVFIGPHTCFTNDKYPKAVSNKGILKTESEWTVYPILVSSGVSIGANSTILPGVKIGKNAMIGAGSVVTRDIPANVVVVGNPIRVIKKLK